MKSKKMEHHRKLWNEHTQTLPIADCVSCSKTFSGKEILDEPNTVLKDDVEEIPHFCSCGDDVLIRSKERLTKELEPAFESWFNGLTKGN